MKDAMIHARISATLLTRLDGVLARKGLSRSEWLVTQVSKYVDEEEEAMRSQKSAPEKSLFQLHAEAFCDCIDANFHAAGPNPARGNLEKAIEAAWRVKPDEIGAAEAREGEALARKLLGKK